MNPVEWAIRPLRHYADFTGRAPRAEYWWYVLAVTIVGALVGLIDARLTGPILGNYGPVGLTFLLIVFIPGLSVAARRMHDIDRTGWWCVLKALGYGFTFAGAAVRRLGSFSEPLNSLMIVLIGVGLCLGIIFFVFLITQGDEGSNRFGPDPYGPDELEEVFA